MSTTTFTSRFRRVLLVTTTSALLAGVVTVTGEAAAAPAAPTAPSRVATASVSTSAQQTAARYWTPERLRAAVDADVMTLPRSAVSSAAPAKAPGPDGPRGQVAGVAPTAPTGKAGKAAGGTLPNGMVPTSLYSTSPYSMNGKIFFTFNGGGYQCSGTSVSAFYNGVQQSEVWTAGHCLANTDRKSPGVWASNVVFIPGYNGAATSPAVREPFGVFPSTRSSSAWNWLQYGQASVDLGAFTVGTSNTGRVLHQSVGAAGFAWNQDPVQTFDAFGYPAVSPYGGNYLYHYRATTSARYTWPGGQGQPMIGIANPMTGGSSGGAWFINWNTGYSGYINGHNDWKIDAASIYSPYFDTLANQVRCFGPVNC